MARVPDFIVRYDPKTDSKEELSKRILYRMFIYPLKKKKPVIVFVSGDSGEGKSWGTLKIQEVLFEAQGIKLSDYLNDINVYTPLQYPEKIKALLFNKKLSKCNNYKKVNMICMHEAREIVKAKQWQSFLAQAVGDINAQSRAIKRLTVWIISQFIRDITTDIRYTLNYYIKSYRSLATGRVRFTIYHLYKDDSDLERPRLRKYKIWGYLVYPDGRRIKFYPQHIYLSRPSKEVTDEFDKQDYESKHYVLERKINKLIYELKLELETSDTKVKAIVDYYTKNPELILLIGKRNRKNEFVVKPEIKTMHSLNNVEFDSFKKFLNEKLKSIGMMETSAAEFVEKIKESEHLDVDDKEDINLKDIN
jgi:hypothetical protein